MRYRLAYSYCAGDCMTIVITQDGELMTHWGTRDFVNCPDKKKAFRMIRNLTRAYKNGLKKYLYDGRMLPSPRVECDVTVFHTQDGKREIALASIVSTAWEAKDGTKALILVNPNEKEKACAVNGKSFTVPPLDVITVEL